MLGLETIRISAGGDHACAIICREEYVMQLWYSFFFFFFCKTCSSNFFFFLTTCSGQGGVIVLQGSLK